MWSPRSRHLPRRPDRRFFHWEIEFPEVFFGFFDPDQRQIKHKERIKAGTAGFDVVIGNPPYVRVEYLEATLKKYLKQEYQTVTDRCDLYIGFIELDLRLLNVNGRFGVVVSNQFMNTDYGRPLRMLLAKKKSLQRIIDIPPLQLFDGALTYPAVIVCTKCPQEKTSVLSMEHVVASQTERIPDIQVFAKNCNLGIEVANSEFCSSEIWSAIRWHDRTGACLEDKAAESLSTICNLSSSMKSGKDDLLVGDLLEESARTYSIAIGKNGFTMNVDRRLWRKVIRPKDIKEAALSIRKAMSSSGPILQGLRTTFSGLTHHFFLRF